MIMGLQDYEKSSEKTKVFKGMGYPLLLSFYNCILAY